MGTADRSADIYGIHRVRDVSITRFRLVIALLSSSRFSPLFAVPGIPRSRMTHGVRESMNQRRQLESLESPRILGALEDLKRCKYVTSL